MVGAKLGGGHAHARVEADGSLINASCRELQQLGKLDGQGRHDGEFSDSVWPLSGYGEVLALASWKSRHFAGVRRGMEWKVDKVGAMLDRRRDARVEAPGSLGRQARISTQEGKKRRLAEQRQRWSSAMTGRGCVPRDG